MYTTFNWNTKDWGIPASAGTPVPLGPSEGDRASDENDVFGVKYFCRSTSTILAGSDGCSFDDAPFGGRCCGF